MGILLDAAKKTADTLKSSKVVMALWNKQTPKLKRKFMEAYWESDWDYLNSVMPDGLGAIHQDCIGKYFFILLEELWNPEECPVCGTPNKESIGGSRFCKHCFSEWEDAKPAEFKRHKNRKSMLLWKGIRQNQVARKVA